MYSQGNGLEVMIVLFMVFVVLLLFIGLTLSIVIFYNHSKGAEVIAWILSTIWLGLYFFLKVLEVRHGVQYAIFPLLITYFFLVWYRIKYRKGRPVNDSQQR